VSDTRAKELAEWATDEADYRRDETSVQLWAIADEIERLEKRVAELEQWHSVKGKLPDNDRYVQIACEEWDAPITAWLDRDGRLAWTDHHGRDVTVRVTHWRETGPLPELPEGK